MALIIMKLPLDKYALIATALTTATLGQQKTQKLEGAKLDETKCMMTHQSSNILNGRFANNFNKLGNSNIAAAPSQKVVIMLCKLKNVL